VFAIEIVSLISSGLQYNLLSIVANDGYVSDEAATFNDIREQIISLILIIANIISAITFIMWFRRAYYNLHQHINYLQYSEGWAAGSWFVPIVNLYRPYRIMRELYVETAHLMRRHEMSDKVRYTDKYLIWWWVLWIVSGFIGNIIFRTSLKDPETIDGYMYLTLAQIVVGILRIALAPITIKIIRDYSKVEPLLIELEHKNVAIKS
jgi:hypothetical protein